MTLGVFYKVIADFDPKKDYGVYLQNRVIEGLKQLKKGREFEQVDIIREWMKNPPIQTKMNEPNMTQLVYTVVRNGKKIGIIDRLTDKKDQEFEDFSNLETVQFWMKRLKDPKQKHPEAIAKKGESGTQYQYRRLLFWFNKWLQGKKIKVTHWKAINADNEGKPVYQKVSETVPIKNAEHLLELHKDSKDESGSDFQKFFFNYLSDPIHKGKKAGSVHMDKCAIESYFTKNYNPLKIDFDVTSKYQQNNGAKDQRTQIKLNDVFNMLTLGRPKIIEKAIVMCKFHAGLDNSTFADSFNFDAWDQLVDYFGTETYEKWELDLCPVPLEIVRMKTQFNYLGFLDRDAIEALQAWLKVRDSKHGPMTSEKPLFVTQKGTPITDQTVACIIPKLARNAGINKRLNSYTRMNRYEKTSHELRDLLNTTLETYGASTYVAELSIGHKHKSSYRKGGQLYPQKLRKEYMKASKALNIFSNVSNYIEKGDEVEAELEEQRSKSKNLATSLEEVRENQQIMNEAMKEIFPDFKHIKELKDLLADKKRFYINKIEQQDVFNEGLIKEFEELKSFPFKSKDSMSDEEIEQQIEKLKESIKKSRHLYESSN